MTIVEIYLEGYLKGRVLVKTTNIWQAEQKVKLAYAHLMRIGMLEIKGMLAN